MAKIVYVCPRSERDGDQWTDALESVSRRLAPDNIETSYLLGESDDGVRYAVVTPPSFLPRDGGSVAIGALAEPGRDWAVPEAAVPEGTYALFRASAAAVELCTDVLASRTIWYFHGERALLASTSQRALIMLLGSFEANYRVLPWVLSAGCLAPGESWDRRLSCVPPNSRLHLDRQSWKVSCITEPVVFRARTTPARTAPGDELETLLRASISKYPFDAGHWIVPLSGGYDSRGLLLFLGPGRELPTLTWGQASSMGRPGNDATIARQLAQTLGLDHSYEATDPGDEPSELILDRFLRLGEGRVDHLAGYLDGFAIWKRLVELGYEGIVRGDEGFGRPTCASEEQVRVWAGMELMTDFANLKSYKGSFCEQMIPEHLFRRSDESLPTWRDRLYHGFRVPMFLSALTDLKASYVEVANPYLSREVIDFVRTLPDRLRTDKVVYEGLIERLSPDIPFATEHAIADMRGALASSSMRQLLLDALSGAGASAADIPTGLRSTALHALTVAPTGSFSRPSMLRTLVSRWTPRRAKALLRKSVARRSVDPYTLAFRIYLLDRMQAILVEDAAALRSAGGSVRAC